MKNEIKILPSQKLKDCTVMTELDENDWLEK
jgi:hypothetical protein